MTDTEKGPNQGQTLQKGPIQGQILAQVTNPRIDTAEGTNPTIDTEKGPIQGQIPRRDSPGTFLILGVCLLHSEKTQFSCLELT